MSIYFDVMLGLGHLAIYFYISQTFRHVSPATLNGAPTYFAFVAVGLIVSVVVQGTAVAVSARIREEQVSGVLEILFAQPLTARQLVLGATAWPLLFAGGRAVLYLGIALPWLGARHQVHWVGLVVLVALTLAATAGLSMMMAALPLLITRPEPLIGVVVLGLTIFGGAVFPISVLPGLLHTVASVTPSRLVFDGIRSALFAAHGWATAALELAAIAALALGAGLNLFSWALNRARRRGGLIHT